ncbi:MAG: pressure-regulated protein [Pseudomonadaceae bacterium]|nr:pressure-regulated protein [Pseudomonadaceae bacterium]
METALLAAISMGRDLLQKFKERTSLTKPTPESEPTADRRKDSTSSHVLDFRQDEHGDWVAILSCGHTQHLRHQPPWQNRAWVLDAQLRQRHIGQPFACGWCASETAAEKR